jgi:hypothetical protein
MANKSNDTSSEGDSMGCVLGYALEPDVHHPQRSLEYVGLAEEAGFVFCEYSTDRPQCTLSIYRHPLQQIEAGVNCPRAVS